MMIPHPINRFGSQAALGFWIFANCVLISAAHAQADDAPAAMTPAQATMKNAPGELAVSAMEIFVAKCAQCHSPESGKRSANKRWSDSTNLSERVNRYVEPETRNIDGCEDSTLWLILTDAPKRRMPPPKSTGGQLTAAELETVKHWIAAGAPVDLPSKANNPSVATTETFDPTVEPGFMERLQRWLGKFHPAAVHLPIGLLLAAAAAELMWWFTGRNSFDFTSRFCTVVGAIGAIPAAALGWMAGSFESDIGYTLTIHRWMGVSVTVLAVVLAVLSLTVANHSPDLAPDQHPHRPLSRSRLILRGLVLVNAALVSMTGHFGGELVHGFDYFTW